MRQTVCPVVVHEGAVLVFRHPLAGMQIVKGGIKPGEHPRAAALRELYEEAGINGRSTTFLGINDAIQPSANWHFYLCKTPPLPDRWSHHCKDDGGHVFRFSWRPLGHAVPDSFDPMFHRAITFISSQIQASSLPKYS